MLPDLSSTNTTLPSHCRVALCSIPKIAFSVFVSLTPSQIALTYKQSQTHWHKGQIRVRQGNCCRFLPISHTSRPPTPLTSITSAIAGTRHRSCSMAGVVFQVSGLSGPKKNPSLSWPLVHILSRQRSRVPPALPSTCKYSRWRSSTSPTHCTLAWRGEGAGSWKAFMSRLWWKNKLKQTKPCDVVTPFDHAQVHRTTIALQLKAPWSAFCLDTPPNQSKKGPYREMRPAVCRWERKMTEMKSLWSTWVALEPIC